MTWHHPNVYKKIRAERKKIPVSGRSLDRATGPAENLNAENSERFVNRASSNKPQAPSVKPQANQGTRHTVQAPSG